MKRNPLLPVLFVFGILYGVILVAGYWYRLDFTWQRSVGLCYADIYGIRIDGREVLANQGPCPKYSL